MEFKDIVKVSVRGLVEFVMKSGDLSSGFVGSSRMVEGTKAHRIVQKSFTDNYSAEVPVVHLLERDGIALEVNGRIDGIINTGSGIIIDEIKSTNAYLDNIGKDYNPAHMAQAKCYAYIYSAQNRIDEIGVRITYYRMDSGETKYIEEIFRFEDLELFFYALVDKYIKWAKHGIEWAKVRDISIREMDFPFSEYRRGQRKFAIAVYKTIRENRKLFAQAPTGTGKTVASLFPAIKALGEGITSKIFYLTAKTITRTAAERALENMRGLGLKLKTVTITAKEKICFKPGCQCNPEECEYARGYYDRIDEAIEELLQFDYYPRIIIEEYARKNCVCPFEFSLDLSNWCDLIICDYNYAFDPRVYLKRFFMDGGDYTFLIDEAHNLADRAREMFSAELFKKPVLELKRAVKAQLPDLYRSLGSINSYMIKLRKSCQEGEKGCCLQKDEPKELLPILREFTELAEEWLTKGHESSFRDELLELYFEAQAFIRVSEYYDERYVTYFEKTGGDVRIKMFCLDPSHLLSEALKRGKSAVFFSATLSPLDYFMEILGGDESSYKLRLPSPFPPQNLCLLIDNRISTKYSMRESTYDSIARSISSLVSCREGNYLVYFPSYKYMNEVYARFCDNNTALRTVCQKSGITEEEKEEFLNEFINKNSETLVGFAVMGGMFGEGIDLVGDLLSGAVIVGVGLPQICLERDIISRYFQESKGMGFEYSYVYPGMNKVLQAVGRVIRTEQDRGVVLLIDERFSNQTYRGLFPVEWSPAWVRNLTMMDKTIKDFWGSTVTEPSFE